MKSSLFLASAAIAASMAMSSCVSPYAGPNESVGGVIGATLGAAAGVIIGHQSGRPLEGAAIGGAIGSLAGSSIGHANDAYAYGYRRPVRVYRTYDYDEAPPVYSYPSYSSGYSYYGGGQYCYPRYYRRCN